MGAVLQAVAGAKAGVEALLGAPAEVRVASAAPGDTLQRWSEVFSTIQVVVAASCMPEHACETCREQAVMHISGNVHVTIWLVMM